MKKTILQLILLAFSILFNGCFPKPILYHSEAKLPYQHSSTKTKFELMNGTFNYEFGIVAAKDNDTLSYVLVVPSYSGLVNIRDLKDVNLNYAITLLPNQANEFVNILESAAANWNENISKKNGTAYEFLIAPENLIVKQSENVYTWYPKLSFYYQNNENGPLCNLFLGGGTIAFAYKFDKVASIKGLAEIIKTAITKEL
ncbi:MAG: hypothetical protein V1773_13900 [bacterium]